MKISFTDFWDGFLCENNFFLDLFKSIDSSVELTSPEESDVLIYSCFGQNHKRFSKRDKIKIFYTGENLRPNYDECEYSFTFDFDDYNGRNIRIPLWLMQIDWFGKTNYGNPQYVIPYNQLDDNEYKKTEKIEFNFCSAIFNTIKPERVETYKALSQYKQVDGYGRPFGNWFYGEDNKLKILARYKFGMCFENTVEYGYVTEKLIHAKVSGTIPIYYGHPGVERDFNESGFINLIHFNSISKLVDYIKKVDSSDELSQGYINAPIFTTDPKLVLDEIKEKIKNLLKI